MIYLEKFFLPDENRRGYPYQVLCSKMIDVISFAPITVFYGSNGSGKSTLLNVIADKIAISHKTKGNRSLYYYDDFLDDCAFVMAERNEKPLKIPQNSRLIRSEDIMNAIVNLRDETKKAENNLLKLQSIDGIGSKEINDALRAYNEIPEQFSNGEVAMSFFDNIFKSDTLYLLDEPDNSLSPVFQSALKEMIERYAHLLNCQFIIATHSPFLLAVENSTVYDLDRCPATVRNWYELENVRIIYDLFKTNKHLFT